MQRDLLQQIWPIFSAEAREHLQSIGAGILELERHPGRSGVLEGVRRTAHSLKGSAASLGLSDVETLAHAIEGSLAGFDPAVGLSADAVQAALDAVEAIEAAVAAADGGAEPAVQALPALLAALGAGGALDASGEPRDAADAADAPPAPPPGAAAGPLGALDALEGRLGRLCAPMDPAERRAVAADAGALAATLADRLPRHAQAVARRLAGAFASLGEEGNDAARSAAAAAGELVELRQALERGDRAEAPASPAAPAADKSIRVLASTLDSLARQLELLALAESRHGRRAREIAAAEASARDAVRALEHAAQAARAAGAEGVRGEIAGAIERLRATSGDFRRIAREGQRDSEQQRLASTVLRDDLRALRMVPAGLVLEPLRRAVRDVAGRTGKDVELELDGADVKLDRRIVDELRDPLLHLVRNAVDHGVEAPAARRAAGKPATGRVRVRVEPRGGRVGLVVEDDGAGLDVARLRASAVSKGVLSAEAAERLPDAEAARLAFHPGLTTAAKVTAVSGRGVGLDVVQETVARLQGSIDVRFAPGEGTRFDLELPLTLAATAAILFRVGRELAALPADAVERVLLLADGDVGTVAGRLTVRHGEQQLPYAPLAQLLGLPPSDAPRKKVQLALVLRLGAQRAAVAVDEVVGQQEVVVSALGSRVAGVAHLAGAAVLDDGRVCAVLNAAEVFRRAQPAAARERASARPRILVADDALTTRAAMKALLEIAGFSVAAVADGEEALALVQHGGVQLVVSDVQMPRLDGFGLARRIKSDPSLRHLPVVLVTSLDSAEDRAAGLESGADAYLVKREVQRGRLIEVVRQLLPGPA